MKSPQYFVNDNGVPSDILQRISKGEKAAVIDCLDKYGKLIWGLSVKFTDTREDAEDAVQEIFIDLWKNAPRFDAAKSPEGAFVTLIARRRLIDHLRKSKIQPPLTFFETALPIQPSNGGKEMQTQLEMKSIV